MKAVKDLRGAGKLLDARGTGILPPNGGPIRLLLAVEHIPVVPNVPGVGDFLTLARVVKDQGLSLFAATDREGNFCIYNRPDVLCYANKGANYCAAGTEHMHMSIEEEWSRMQLRASAWGWQYLDHAYGIPMQMAKLLPGDGQVGVARKGHTSHQNVSNKAGFHDRTDPGPKYDWDYVKAAAEFFVIHGGFTRRTAGGWVGV
jgi:hypothetical protein